MHHPIQHAARRSRGVSGGGALPGFQRRVQPPGGTHQNQLFPGSGHAHVQKPRFLRPGLLFPDAGQGAESAGFPGGAPFRVDVLQSHAILGVKPQLAPIPLAEGPGHFQQEHDGKFQPLGFMQGQDADHILVFAQRLGGFSVVSGMKPARLPQESVQPLLGAFTQGPFGQQAQVGLPQLPFLQGPGPHVQPAFF